MDSHLPPVPAEPGLPRPFPGGRLRRLGVADLPAFQAYRALPGLGRFQGWTPMGDEPARAFLQAMACAPLFAPGEWVQLGIAAGADDALVGDVGLHLAADGSHGEIGFTLAPAAQGRGLATAAAREALALLFGRTSAREVLGITDMRNDASLRLLQRLGFVPRETRRVRWRGEDCTEAVLALARADLTSGASA